MNKLFYIIVFIALTVFSGTFTLAEEKVDCSKYSAKTYTGLIDKMRCKRGEKVEERVKPKKFSDLNPFKSKNKKTNVAKEKISCDEYTNKTIIGLIGKLKCKN